MTRAVSAVAALLAAAALTVTLTRPAPSVGNTSCAQTAYGYVAQVARTQHLKIVSYKLEACRQTDATHSVARAHVVVSYQGLVQDVVLVYHLTKSPWQISDVHPAN